MFNRRHYENSESDGIAVLEVVPAAPAGAEAPRLFVPLKRSELHGEIAGPLADLRLVQTFGYSRAQCDAVLEAVYRFPLPGDAAVSGVRVRFGDVEIVAELKERQKAEADYAEAKQKGQQAALATRESPDVFTLQVAGLQPDQDVVVETRYVQLAQAEGAGWSLRIPLTTSPRYVRSDEITSRHAAGQPLLLLRDPGHRFALDLLLSGAAVVKSPTHALKTSNEGAALRVQLQAGEVLPDRDCLLAWEPQMDERRPALHVMLHGEPADGQLYFLALATPPAAPAAGSTLPREVILLVDHSGSMSGAKWEAADWAVKRFLYGLRAEDAVSLGLFHNTTRWFSDKPVPATPKNVEALVGFLEAHKDSGGTELGVALEQALGQARAASTPARHLFIITDAEVSDEGRILRLADAEAARVDRRRISVLCIDAALNAFLDNELPGRGGGMARFLTSQPDEGDLSTALDEIMADWGAPLYAGVRLEVNRSPVESGGAAVFPVTGGRQALDVGDLPAGRPRWIVGRAPRRSEGQLALRLVDAGGKEVAALTVDVAAETRSRPALKALFGARRILGLEFLISAGYDADELAARLARLGYDPALVQAGAVARPVYAENLREATAKALKDLLVAESLCYGLASSETGFIAIRKEAGQKIAGSVAVANALPAGWSEQFLATTGAALPPPAPAFGVAFGPSLQDMMSRPLFRTAEAAPPGQMAPTLARSAPARQRARLAPAKTTAATTPTQAGSPHAPLFRGTPTFVNGQAVLFDSTAGAGEGALPDDAVFKLLKLKFPKGVPSMQDVGRELWLLVYIDDPVSPRARIRLADLIQQGGRRPLNLARRGGQSLRLVLEDPTGVWAAGAPQIEVYVEW